MGTLGIIYYYALGWFIKKTFRLWERMGVHLTLNSFYEPVPDTRNLKDTLWSGLSDMVGIDANRDGQIKLLSEFRSQFKNEYDIFPREQTTVPYQYFVNNNSFESVDGELYYCTIRHFKPRRIIEIGSGYSTFLGAQAVMKNKEVFGIDCEYVAIDPYPNQTIQKGFTGLSRVIKSKVEDVDLRHSNK